MQEPIEINVRDYKERGWWVDQSQWFKQKVWSPTGIAVFVKLTNGDITRGLLLYGYNGWHDCNYEPINVAQWLKPERWFSSPDDMEGKVAEYAAWRYSVLHERPPTWRAQAQQKGPAS